MKERDMSTPRVTELPFHFAATEHDDFGDEPATAPRRPPYHRPSQRELVRLSLDRDWTQHDVYPRRKGVR